jgi:hypothetical protein
LTEFFTIHSKTSSFYNLIRPKLDFIEFWTDLSCEPLSIVADFIFTLTQPGNIIPRVVAMCSSVIYDWRNK